MKRFVKGDGHPVLFLPGFGGSDVSTAPMRKLIQDLGYQTYGWGLGRNLFFDDHLEEEMVAMLNEIYAKHPSLDGVLGGYMPAKLLKSIQKSYVM